jgi:hypothetical protein
MPGGVSVVCDYWALVRKAPTKAVLVRFWRSGADDQADERLYDDMADSFSFIGPSTWQGLNRPFAMNQYAAPPPDEPTPEGSWRWGGWRLGTVFHTKLIPAGSQELLMASGTPRKQFLAVFALFVAWLAVALALIGFETGIFLFASFSFMGSLGLVRKYGSRGILAYAMLLVGLLAVGLR